MLWQLSQCRRVDICQGCRVAAYVHVVRGRDTGREGHRLQLYMCFKCNAKYVIISLFTFLVTRWTQDTEFYHFAGAEGNQCTMAFAI